MEVRIEKIRVSFVDSEVKLPRISLLRIYEEAVNHIGFENIKSYFIEKMKKKFLLSDMQAEEALAYLKYGLGIQYDQPVGFWVLLILLELGDLKISVCEEYMQLDLDKNDKFLSRVIDHIIGEENFYSEFCVENLKGFDQETFKLFIEKIEKLIKEEQEEKKRAKF
jgi:hypothetical protein